MWFPNYIRNVERAFNDFYNCDIVQPFLQPIKNALKFFSKILIKNFKKYTCFFNKVRQIIVNF